MSRQAKLIIYGLVILFSIYLKQGTLFSNENTKVNPIEQEASNRKSNNVDEDWSKYKIDTPKKDPPKKKPVAKTSTKKKPIKNISDAEKKQRRIDSILDVNRAKLNKLIGDKPIKNASNNSVSSNSRKAASNECVKYVSRRLVFCDDGTLVADPQDFIDDLTFRPANGFSPYDKYFGKGIYDKSTSNYVEIDNQSNNDAIVLLVNAYSNKKIRNEYVRKKSKFKMEYIPDGVYYLRSMSGNDWISNLKIGKLRGGFTRERSISGNSDSKDWVKLGTTYANSEGEYTQGYRQTIHTVVGGNLKSEVLTEEEFSN